MIKILTFLPAVFVYVIFYVNSYSQNRTEYDLFTHKDQNSIPNLSELEGVVSNAVILNINKSELINLCENRSTEISLTIPYLEGNTAKLNLRRLDVLTPDVKTIARTINGNEEVILDDAVVSYGGNVEGFENTLVVINFTKDNITGLMSSENDNYILGSLKNYGETYSDNYILYKESDLKLQNIFNCGTSDLMSDEAMEKMKKSILEKMNDASPTDLLVANIAIDIDYSTYINFGSSVTSATNYVLSLMSAVSAIYMKEVNVKLRVSYLRVWTTPDPYTGTSSLAVLNQFVNEWVTNQGAVSRTLAHLISTRSNNLGGIAYVDVLCDPFYGYAFSNTHATSVPLPTYSWDVDVVSHETGHNFGSLHTHNCSWVGGPIDTCYRPEGGCYDVGPLKPRVGTIMSYCHLNASKSFILGFGTQPRALMRSRAESAFCMNISSKPLEVAYPNGGEVLRKGKYIQIYWGTSLTGNINIELTTNNGANWQTVQNNVPAVQRALDWLIPNVAVTSQAKIRILNSSNLNMGDTSDAAFSIQTYLNPFNITIGIEGFWNGSTQVQDAVILYFRASTPPYNKRDSSIVLLNPSGNAVAGFSNISGGNYYIQVIHRNALETWSSAAVNFTTGVTTNYNFTTFQSQAYGNNQKFKLGRWCFYSGDVNIDGIIDAADLSSVDNAAFSSVSGYVSEDVTGDNFVDASDLSIVDNNAVNSILVLRP